MFLEIATPKKTPSEGIMLHEILDYIEGNRVTSYRALVQYARQCRPEWKRTIRANSTRVTRFIKARSRDAQG